MKSVSRSLSSIVLVAAAMLPATLWAQSATNPGAVAPNTDNTVLIRGPGGEVTTAQFLAAVEQLVPLNQRESFFSNPNNIEQLALSIYSRQTLAAQARQQGFDRKPEVERVTAIAQQQTLSDLWLTNQAEAKLPSPQQLEQYARSVYESQSSATRETTQLRVRHIMIGISPSLPDDQAKAKAESLLAQIKAGAEFQQLARAESTDKGSAPRGGELLQPMELGSDRSAFEVAAAALTKPGQTSEVVKSNAAYHIIQLIERKTLSGFDRRRDEIVEQSKVQLTAKARADVLRGAQAGAEPNEEAISALVRSPAAK
ncbi:peptidylprolyl isomerase [Ottowia thiooxydans]|uniref:peptidylprolyl isomerase n=1 Tax=Ottowia thiooxydans TaxID=219182 RepID=A0ABV2QEN9_9BURK